MKHLKNFRIFESARSKYPSMDQVQSASHHQLGSWMRYLDSPGMSAVGEDNFEEIRIKEAEILDAISIRFKEAGGWNPQLSKSVGWD